MCVPKCLFYFFTLLLWEPLCNNAHRQTDLLFRTVIAEGMNDYDDDYSNKGGCLHSWRKK